MIPKETRTAFRAEGEPFSERSDAGNLIVQEVFGFVKREYPERSGGRMPQAGKGARGKGRQLFSPPQQCRNLWRALARRLSTATLLAHRITAHFDAMSIVNETVKDSVGGRGIADLFVPAGNR